MAYGICCIKSIGTLKNDYSLLSKAYLIQLMINEFILTLFSLAVLDISSYISGVTLIGILILTFFAFQF